MDVDLHELHGNWDKGFALHKHVLKSVPIGYNQYGHMQFDNTRSDPGEALYKLKYKCDFSQVNPLAQAIYDHVVPVIGKFDMVIPMPATKPRPRQPVHAITEKLSDLTSTFYADGLLLKKHPVPGGPEIKNLSAKEERVAALGERFVLDAVFVSGGGPWDVLLVDDKYDTGASLEAACGTLRACAKIRKIFVTACSW